MPFDDAKMESPAISGDVAGAYLYLATAISPILAALEKIESKTGLDFSDEKAVLTQKNADAWERFTALSGWKTEK